MQFNMRKTVAAFAAVAALGVAGPMAVSTAYAADDATAASCVKQHEDGNATVTFCNPDGSVIQSVAYKADDAVKFSVFAIGQDANVTVPEGKAFDHWAYTGSTEAVDPDMPVSQDIAVYPVFKDAPVEQVTVTFYDGDDNELLSVTLDKGAAFSEFAGQAEEKLTVPEGKTLAGWYMAGSDQLIDPAGQVNADWPAVYPKFEDKAVEAERVPVYRLYNPGLPQVAQHLYTASKAEYDDLIANHGWKGEDIQFYTTSDESAEPVYRVYNPYTSEHFLTSDKAEYEDLYQNKNWQDDGLAWYIPADGDTDVYRLRNETTGEHLYTVSAAEKDDLTQNAGWVLEGAPYKVYAK